jgi:hypothetical protein
VAHAHPPIQFVCSLVSQFIRLTVTLFCVAVGPVGQLSVRLSVVLVCSTERIVHARMYCLISSVFQGAQMDELMIARCCGAFLTPTHPQSKSQLTGLYVCICESCRTDGCVVYGSTTGQANEAEDHSDTELNRAGYYADRFGGQQWRSHAALYKKARWDVLSPTRSCPTYILPFFTYLYTTG